MLVTAGVGIVFAVIFGVKVGTGIPVGVVFAVTFDVEVGTEVTVGVVFAVTFEVGIGRIITGVPAVVFAVTFGSVYSITGVVITEVLSSAKTKTDRLISIKKKSGNIIFLFILLFLVKDYL